MVCLENGFAVMKPSSLLGTGTTILSRVMTADDVTKGALIKQTYIEACREVQSGKLQIQAEPYDILNDLDSSYRVMPELRPPQHVNFHSC